MNKKIKILFSILGILAFTESYAYKAEFQNEGRNPLIINQSKKENNSAITDNPISIDEKSGVITSVLSYKQSTKSFLSKITQNQNVMLGIYDPSSYTGTIQLVSMKRFSDKSAQMISQLISPYDFDLGKTTLNYSDLEKFNYLYGGNPFNEFKGIGYKKFAHITLNGFQTAMGLLMKFSETPNGMLLNLNPEINSEETRSGELFKKDISISVKTRTNPKWYLLMPINTGSDKIEPYYILKGKIKVNSGINLFEIGNLKNNFVIDKTTFWHENKTIEEWDIDTATSLFNYAISAFDNTVNHNDLTGYNNGSERKEQAWNNNWKKESKIMASDAPLSLKDTIGTQPFFEINQINQEKENWEKIISPENTFEDSYEVKENNWCGNSCEN